MFKTIAITVGQAILVGGWLYLLILLLFVCGE